MRAIFIRCPEGCRRGWIPIVITDLPCVFPGGAAAGGGSLRCTCRVPGYVVRIVREIG